MADVMTKYKAEQVLGLAGTYDIKSLSRAYRKAVKENHPDMGGSEEKMIEVNAAKEYLDTYFDTDESATVTCSTHETYEAKATTSSGYSHGGYDSQSYGYAHESSYAEAEDSSDQWSDAFNDFVNSWTQTHAKPGDAYSAATGAAAGASATGSAASDAAANGTAGSDGYAPPDPADKVAGQSAAEAVGYSSIDDFERKVAAAAAAVVVEAAASYVANNDGAAARARQKRGDVEGAPTWWKVANWFASKFQWRLVFWLIMFVICMTIVMDDALLSTPEGALTICACLFASFLNIFGIITTPIKKAIRSHADDTLMKWARKRGKRVDWVAETIV